MEEDLGVSLWLRSGPVPDFTRRIPGLKSETWGTLRLFPGLSFMVGSLTPLCVCPGLFLGGVIVCGAWGLGETEQVGEEAVGSRDALG